MMNCRAFAINIMGRAIILEEVYSERIQMTFSLAAKFAADEKNSQIMIFSSAAGEKYIYEWFLY